jgi:hypothetical protein
MWLNLKGEGEEPLLQLSYADQAHATRDEGAMRGTVVLSGAVLVIALRGRAQASESMHPGDRALCHPAEIAQPGAVFRAASGHYRAEAAFPRATVLVVDERELKVAERPTLGRSTK